MEGAECLVWALKGVIKNSKECLLQQLLELFIKRKRRENFMCLFCCFAWDPLFGQGTNTW